MAPVMKGLMLALAAAGASAQIYCKSWGPNRGDIFVTYDNKLFHKFWTGYDWQPVGATAEILSAKMNVSNVGPTISSWQAERLGAFWIGADDGAAHEQHWNGEEWQPNEGEMHVADFLNGPPGGFIGPLATSSYAVGFLSIVATGANGSAFQKVLADFDWVGGDEGDWDWLGGRFAGATDAKWVGEQLHVVAISNGSRQLHHKFWDNPSQSWYPSPKGWETLKGGPFEGEVTISYWGDPDRFDLWAIGADGQLYGKYWQTDAYSDWASFGGTNLTGKPLVISPRPGAFEIIATKAAEGGGFTYMTKSYDGHGNWYPSPTEWYEQQGVFEGSPGIISWSDTTVAYFGVSKGDAKLRFRYWWGEGWFPEDGSWQVLADLKASESSAETEALRKQELR